MSRHLQQIALAIPRADYSADDENLEGGSDISQKNARGSRSEENQDATSGGSDSDSEIAGDQATVTRNAAAENYEACFEEPTEQVEFPY